MRFMVLVKADKNSEAGVLPDEKMLTEMGKFNEELVKAGVLLAGEGLQPSSKGARVKFSGAKRTVIDGPFAETKELIAGFWLWQVKSKEEAIEWVKRCPNPLEGESVIEIRQVQEMSDFPADVQEAAAGGCELVVAAGWSALVAPHVCRDSGACFPGLDPPVASAGSLRETRSARGAAMEAADVEPKVSSRALGCT